MAKKKQEQQEQSQDEHVMAVLDKRTNKTAVKRTTTVFSNWTVPHLWNCSSRISRTSTKIPQASVSSLYHLPFWTRH